MANSSFHLVRPGYEHEAVHDPEFPYAPMDWSREDAQTQASREGLTLNEHHWQVIRALQEYFYRHQDALAINTRELHDALNEAFHTMGGIKYLYEVFPGGPVAQGCRIAGLKAPAGVNDRGFGSAV